MSSPAYSHPHPGRELSSEDSFRARRAIRFRFNPLSLLLLIFLVIAVLSLFSLTRLNSMSTQGYVIQELEHRNQALVEDSEVNSMLILQARSLDTIRGSEVVAQMVAPKQVYYLQGLTDFAKVYTDQ